MNRLYLVRHGENPANLTKQFSHRQIDYSLNAKGVLQAQQTAAYFQQHTTLHAVYSSPLKRAYETGGIIAAPFGLTVSALEQFREINIGDLEMQPVSDELWAYHERIVDQWYAGRTDLRFPGGEDYRSLLERIRAGLVQVLAGRQEQNVVVVGHGGWFRCTLKDLCANVDASLLRTLDNHNCSVTELHAEVVDGQLHARLVRYADHSHLHGAAAALIAGTPVEGELPRLGHEYPPAP
ncbi:MAG: histidine phosphatase family protein [Chloroflexi bacterium]|nr:histidine phosphatase family protein [Anaerolineaceae bacterium]NMB90913.1 histidine phosphatase family protein [Chloroflexota bacterium]